MKRFWMFLAITVSGLFTGCAPFNGDVPETHPPPATSAPGQTRRPS